ncbi:hypothetical protein, partial [Acinetobacter pittii]|uniref:hypothetical protein n=1 Tax=Acinetobacter pittii TaxID=48296 RepID=UPI00374EF755
MAQAIVAYLHYLSIFLLFALLVLQHRLLRLPLDLELREGDELLQRCAERGGPEIAAACAPLAERLQACQSVEERVALWLAAQTGELLRLVGPREHL